MERVVDIIKKTGTGFSFELLPPLKGNSVEKVYRTIDELREFNPQYINITTHHSEETTRITPEGKSQRYNVRKRPGTVAIAAAIRYKYGIPVVPHIICSGFTKEETEYALMDLNFLGIHDLLILRGDKGRLAQDYGASGSGHKHATGLQNQINEWNEGYFLDKAPIEECPTPFSYGVAGYPEKHEEAESMETDLFWLKKKVEAGAEYIVTQMFFDNAKYFQFVERCRSEGITVPIIPGIKPITTLKQLTVLPNIFSCEIPEALRLELERCSSEEAVRRVGVDWSTQQGKELIERGAPMLHFYTMLATNSVRQIAQNIF